MGYTPTSWSTGDVITAEKLNKIEDGIAVAGGFGTGLFVIHATGTAGPGNPQTQPTFDKTYEEVLAAFNSGLIPTVLFSGINSTGHAMFVSYSQQGAFMFSASIQGLSENTWSVSQTDIILANNGMSMSMWTEVFLATVT